VAWAGSIKTQFSQSPLQIVPGFQAGLLGAAKGLGLVGANENVTFNAIDSQGSHHGEKRSRLLGWGIGLGIDGARG
jgi:hypothetical protein